MSGLGFQLILSQRLMSQKSHKYRCINKMTYDGLFVIARSPSTGFILSEVEGPRVDSATKRPGTNLSFRPREMISYLMREKSGCFTPTSSKGWPLSTCRGKNQCNPEFRLVLAASYPVEPFSVRRQQLRFHKALHSRK